MSFDDLSLSQRTQLAAIRRRRRELTQEATREHRDLLQITNDAATRRSQKRHRFMLLAGAIVGVAVPLLLQRAAFLDADVVRTGSVLLLVHIVVGAVFDAIDERRTTPLLHRGGAALGQAVRLALLEDSKMIAALAGEPVGDLEPNIQRANKAVEDAHATLKNAGESFATISAVEAVLFFGSFLVGVGMLVWAVGKAGPS